MLKDAKGLAIMTVIKAGFGMGCGSFKTALRRITPPL